MAAYVVVACSRCGRYLLAKDGQKTRSCAYCGYTIVLEKAKKVASAERIADALKLVSKAKSNASGKKETSMSFRVCRS